MSKSPLKNLWISREVRLAIIVAILSAIGTFACAEGAWTEGVALFAIAVGLVAAFWMAVVRPARIPRDAVVMVRLGGPVHEDSRRSPIEQLIRHGAPSMYHLRYGLEAAATDPGVRAVIVHVAGVEAGLATAHELHRLLRAIRAGGKRVIAIMAGDGLTIRDYLIAAGAGEVVANPDTMLMMLGVAMGNPFVREALDRIGIRAQTLQWKEYKGAAETLSRDTMSPALRESLEAIIADWREILTGAIAEARGLEPERARELIGAGFLSARAAREAKLIDRDGYIEDVRAEFDPDGNGKCFVGFGRYIRHAMYRRERGRRARIALVTGAGPVIAGEAPAAGEFISGETTAAQIDRASRDDSICAIVFRVNSPGGSAVGSEMVWRAVREAQGRGKPVVVSMGDVAGSGGYYIAMGADAIVAEPATITGSIGVVYAKFDLSRMLARFGVRLEYVKSNDISDALSLSRAMSESELAQIDASIGEVYGNFTAKVAEGRRLEPAEAEALARGRVWSGVAAKSKGLVDDLGGLARAVEIARERAHIAPEAPHQLVAFAPRDGLLTLRQIISPASSHAGADLLASALGVPVRWAPAMLKIIARGGIMLMCSILDG